MIRSLRYTAPLLALFGAGCFGVSLPGDIACGTNQECPSGLVCDTSDQICRSNIGGGPNDAAIDGPIAPSDGGVDGGLLDAGPDTVRLAQSDNLSTINLYVVCRNNTTGFVAETRLFRLFDLAAEGVPAGSTLHLDTFTTGINIATAGGGAGTQPAAVRFFVFDSAAEFVAANLVIGDYSRGLAIADTATPTVVSYPVDYDVPGGKFLAVEFYAADGQAEEHLLQLGCNDTGVESGPTYILECGFAEVTNIDGIANPNPPPADFSTHYWLVYLDGTIN